MTTPLHPTDALRSRAEMARKKIPPLPQKGKRPKDFPAERAGR